MVRHLLEHRNWNRTLEQVPLGVPGSPEALAGNQSIATGYGHYVVFDRTLKYRIPAHRTLGTPSRFGRVLALLAAGKRSSRYFSHKQSLSAMIKEPKNVDFYTTGRQPSEQEFARISAWIKRDKKKQAARNAKPTSGLTLLSR